LDAEAARELQQGELRRIGIEADHLSVSRFNRLERLLGPPGAVRPDRPLLSPTTRIVERMRAVKDAGEIETIREAGRRISAVARRARTWIQPGRTEREIAAAVDGAMRDAGFDRPAFETIVSSGPNTALPHARPTSRVVGPNDCVLLDFGGVYDGYCVDLTRTVHIGPMPEAFRRLFDAVRQAQAAAIAVVKAGARGVDVDDAARQVMVGHGLAEAFGHGTGHGLGLEVHEEPRISPLAPADEPLQAGMVVTIEPGAYVPGTGGVRIEDDVLVTEEGCEWLTDVPIEL
jgi:Xaa-Pro aminopeptidase